MSNEMRTLMETLTRIEEDRQTEEEQEFYNLVQRIGDNLGLITDDVVVGGVFVREMDDPEWTQGLRIETDDKAEFFRWTVVDIDNQGKEYGNSGVDNADPTEVERLLKKFFWLK